MKLRIIFFLVLAMAGMSSAQSAPAPQIGDYKSVAVTGAWTATTTWNVYTSTGWAAATQYPGQNTTTTAQGTYKVFIAPGTNVTVSGTQTYYFGDLYVLANLPVTNLTTDKGIITLFTNMATLALLGTNQDVYVLGGIINFSQNNTALKLRLGSSLILTNYNGATSNTGTNLIQPERSELGNCTGNKQIKFVDGTTELNFAVCGGSNSTYNFWQLNSNGGSINAIPSATPNSVCLGSGATSVTLSGTYTGFIPTADSLADKNYLWTLVSGPTGGFTPPLPTTGSTSATQTLTFATAGIYVFNLKVYYTSTLGYDISGNQTVTVTVYPAGDPACACYKPAAAGIGLSTNHGITALQRAGAQDGNWPMIRSGAHTALEAKTKGFVINRMVSPETTIANPVEGMLVFDTDENVGQGCLKIYKGTAWTCLETQTCTN